MSKRILDLCVALGMIIPLLPLMAVVAIILKLTGEHQALYFQPRRGARGEHFGLMKFVTMVANAENMGTKDITVRNDPRVLPFGRFLRKTKINELPQLLNVLKGDMSIVGWRPLMDAGFDGYPDEVQQELIKVRPGLTGMGSIIFRDEEKILEITDKEFVDCYREDILPYKGALELWYIRHQTIGLDIKIILATAIAVLLPSSQSYLNMFPDLPRPSESSEIARIRNLQLETSVS